MTLQLSSRILPFSNISTQFLVLVSFFSIGVFDVVFVIKVLLGERSGCKVDNIVPSRAGLRTVLEVLKIQMNFWPTLESIRSTLQSQWGVHAAPERSECKSLF